MRVYLLSPVRCGSNYLSYLIETIFNIEVIPESEDFTIYCKNHKTCYIEALKIIKTHGEGISLYEDDLIIGIIRNYKDLYGRLFTNENKKNLLLQENLKSFIDGYKKKVNMIINQKNHLLLYYEDLINNPKLIIENVSNFLSIELPNKKIDFEELKKNSLNQYPCSKSNEFKEGCYLNFLNSDIIKKLDYETNEIKCLNRYSGEF